jgi:MFS family permease
MNLGSLLGFGIAQVLSGIFIKITGYCQPYMIFSSIVAAASSGLITTFTVTTSPAVWIILQISLGLGVGMGIQRPMNAIQVSRPAKDLPIGIAVLCCSHTMAAAIFSSVAQSIFVNKVMSGVKANFPGDGPTVVLRNGILNLKFADGLNEAYLPEIYNKALVDVFYLSSSLIAFSIFGALVMDWRRVEYRPSVNRDEDNEEASHQLHPWSALWTYISKIFSRLWEISMPNFFACFSVPNKYAPRWLVKRTTEHVPDPVRREDSASYSRSGRGGVERIPEPSSVGTIVSSTRGLLGGVVEFSA